MSGQDEDKIEDQRLELLLTEYQEAGEEARSRDRLIHNTFYLVIFAIGAFVITELNAITRGENLNIFIISVISFFVFSFLAIVIYTYSTYRASQWSRRRAIEEEIHAHYEGVFLIQSDAVNKRLTPGKSAPREHNLFEGLGTKYISHIVFILALLSLLPAIGLVLHRVLLAMYDWFGIYP